MFGMPFLKAPNLRKWNTIRLTRNCSSGCVNGIRTFHMHETVIGVKMEHGHELTLNIHCHENGT